MFNIVKLLRSYEMRAREAGYCDLAVYYQFEADRFENNPDTAGLSSTNSYNIAYCILDKRDPLIDASLLGEKSWQVAKFEKLANSAAPFFMFHVGNLVAGAELMDIVTLTALNNDLEDALDKMNIAVDNVMKALYE